MTDPAYPFLPGTRVQIGSVWRVLPRSQPGQPQYRPGVNATGTVRGYSANGGVIVDFDDPPVNGLDFCIASVNELSELTDGGAS